MKIPKYGMRAETIRYWQDRAKRLRLTHDIRVSVSDALLRTGRAREIAHAAIGAAAVHSAHEMRAMLKGETK